MRSHFEGPVRVTSAINWLSSPIGIRNKQPIRAPCLAAARRLAKVGNPPYQAVRHGAGEVRKGARLCGNGLEIAVLGDSALGASALESRSLGLWGLGDASVHRWRRSDATGAATAQP